MAKLNDFLNDFNGTSAGAAAAGILILLTGVVVAGRLAFGKPFPDGYEPWLFFLATLEGVNTAGMGVKRLTDFRYKAAGPPNLTVESPGPVNVTTTAAAPAAEGVAAPSAPAQPGNDPSSASAALRAATTTLDPARPVGAQVEGEGD